MLERPSPARPLKYLQRYKKLVWMTRNSKAGRTVEEGASGTHKGGSQRQQRGTDIYCQIYKSLHVNPTAAATLQVSRVDKGISLNNL